MVNTKNDTATASLKPIIYTWPNLQMLILNLLGPVSYKRAKRIFFWCWRES